MLQCLQPHMTKLFHAAPFAPHTHRDRVACLSPARIDPAAIPKSVAARGRRWVSVASKRRLIRASTAPLPTSPALVPIPRVGRRWISYALRSFARDRQSPFSAPVCPLDIWRHCWISTTTIHRRLIKERIHAEVITLTNRVELMVVATATIKSQPHPHRAHRFCLIKNIFHAVLLRHGHLRR